MAENNKMQIRARKAHLGNNEIRCCSARGAGRGSRAETGAQQRSRPCKVTRDTMDAAGTALARRWVRAWGGDGPPADGCGVTVPAQNGSRGDEEAGKKWRRSRGGTRVAPRGRSGQRVRLCRSTQQHWSPRLQTLAVPKCFGGAAQPPRGELLAPCSAPSSARSPRAWGAGSQMGKRKRGESLAGGGPPATVPAALLQAASPHVPARGASEVSPSSGLSPGSCEASPRLRTGVPSLRRSLTPQLQRGAPPAAPPSALRGTRGSFLLTC